MISLKVCEDVCLIVFVYNEIRYDINEIGLKGIFLNCSNCLSHLLIQTPNNIEFTASPSSGGLEANERSEAVHHTIKDLHLELLYMFHRVCLKLAGLLDSKKTKKGNRDVSARTGQRMSASSGLRMVRPSDTNYIGLSKVNKFF